MGSIPDFLLAVKKQMGEGEEVAVPGGLGRVHHLFIFHKSEIRFILSEINSRMAPVWGLRQTMKNFPQKFYMRPNSWSRLQCLNI